MAERIANPAAIEELEQDVSSLNSNIADEITKIIPTEYGTTFTKAYTKGEYFYDSQGRVRVLVDNASAGETISSKSDLTYKSLSGSIGTEVNALNSKILNIFDGRKCYIDFTSGTIAAGDQYGEITADISGAGFTLAPYVLATISLQTNANSLAMVIKTVSASQIVFRVANLETAGPQTPVINFIAIGR